MASIFETLNFKDLGLGKVQSVDEMTVIPIVGSDRGNVASPSSLIFRRTVGYGVMEFSNEEDKPAIVPSNMMVRGAGAQDHAMSGSGVIAAKSVGRFENACCIEESQGGYLKSSGNEEDILPAELRKKLLTKKKRNERQFGKLWEDIRDWLRGVISQSRAHLRYFYDDKDFRPALEEFAAEFEPVDGQIGAIILFNGVPVGLEIMPSTGHWDAYWKHLLRGCYGAELLRLKKLGRVKSSTLILPDIPPDAEPSDVKEILENFTEHLRQEILPLIETINISRAYTISNDSGLETRMVITSDRGGGDVIFQGNEPIYVSLIL